MAEYSGMVAIMIPLGHTSYGGLASGVGTVPSDSTSAPEAGPVASVYPAADKATVHPQRP